MWIAGDGDLGLSYMHVRIIIVITAKEIYISWSLIFMQLWGSLNKHNVLA